jgi:hypothetical protein
VFLSNKPKIATFRADFATHADFCDVLKSDTKPLYLLAFLLSANHKDSEKCFISTVAEAFKERAVFKEWARSWVKRRLIKNAIEIVSPASVRNGQRRDLWGAAQREAQRECGIDSVTKLAAFERFAFVMSILERYSNWDCALLLGCKREPSSTSANESFVPASGTRSTPSARQWSAIAPSGSHGVTICLQTRKGGCPLSPIAKLLSLLLEAGRVRIVTHPGANCPYC